MRIRFVLVLTILMVAAGSVISHGAERTPSPSGAQVYFISPMDNDTISGPVTVRFGLKGMGIAPAGVDKKNTGHHHLLIDVSKVSFDSPVPKDKNHMHFGGGQTEATINLKPGKHTLQLVLGDFRHIPHSPPVVSKKITITVK